MPTPPPPSRDDDEHVDGTVVLWKEFGYRPFLDGWNEDPTHKGGEDSVEGRWMPLDTYNALLARANTATVAADMMRARAERAEALLREERMYVEAFDGAEEGSDLCRVKVDIPEDGYPRQYAVEAAKATLARIDAALGEGGA